MLPLRSKNLLLEKSQRLIGSGIYIGVDLSLVDLMISLLSEKWLASVVCDIKIQSFGSLLCKTDRLNRRGVRVILFFLVDSPDLLKTFCLSRGLVQ